VNDILNRICADKRKHVEAQKNSRTLLELETAAGEASPSRGFKKALSRAVKSGGFGLIAEIKKASPSKGEIRKDFKPIALAQAYQRGGACCLSILTDKPYFQGSDDFLVQARAAVNLPVLRKDFMLDPYQIVEARALGADCILLIMAALSDKQAAELEAVAEDWDMDVLVEIHDGEELDRALSLNSRLIGINNRNLKTMVTNLATTEELASNFPSDVLRVSESGLNSYNDLTRMSRVDCHCFLVGEALMRQQDVESATRNLLSPTDDKVMGN